MESIYAPERFKSSDNINLKTKFDEFSSSISSELMFEESNEEFLDSMKKIIGIDVSPEEMHELEKQCSIDNLLCEGEIKKKQTPQPQQLKLRDTLNDEYFTEQAVDLEVLKKKNAMENIRSCENMFTRNKEIFHAPVTGSCKDENFVQDLGPGCDFVMSIFFYKPFRYNFQTKNNPEKFRFSQEIQMLGSNRLSELRDIIACASDAGIQSEVESPTADISHLTRAKETYPSASFFIDGVFYNDMRSPNAIDYSKNIIDWAFIRQIGKFTKADMNQTKLVDLTPRFGYPYVYLHQGNCEHIMVFVDAHILTINDCLSSHQYPRIFSVNKTTNTMCNMCNLFVACWLVRDYDRLPQSSTFLCTKCTELYCYKDGQKIGEFKLYPTFPLHKYKDNAEESK